MYPMNMATIDALVAERQREIAKMMLASKQRSGFWPRVGLLLIRLGEKLRHDAPPAEEVVTLEHPRPSRPGVPT